MAVDVKKLIAAINPDLYCSPEKRKEVKEIVKKTGYLAAAKEAEFIESNYMDLFYTQFVKSPFALEGFNSPTEQHKLVYDASAQSLEQIYFWILDFVNTEYGKSEKLVDNFVASPSSGIFAEMGQRLTRMQEEGMKIFGTINNIIRSIMNIIYDLKEFKIRLELYDSYKKEKDKRKKEAALLSLKQIWMDRVDVNRGAGSINGLSQQLDFVTLRDAFMYVGNLKDVDEVDLNERVKRLLKQRVSEFFLWVDQSEIELRKRYEIEKSYLRSQINSVRLYARWAKPYLKTAKELEQRATPTAALVNSFNTSVFELTLLGEGKYELARDVGSGELPKFFKNLKLRKYVPIVLVEFNFRSIPERSDQRGGFTFRGRAELTFTGLSLNEDELKILKEKIAEDDIGDLYNLIEGATEKSFSELQKDIEEFLEEEKKDEKEEKDKEDVNPFAALFSFWKTDKKEKKDEKKKDLSKGIEKDSEHEKVIRNQTILAARISCRKLYDSYKGSNQMPSFPPSNF